MAAEKIPGEFHRPSDAVEFYEHHMSDLSSLMKGEMAIYLNENTFYDADGVEVTNAAKKKANVKKYEALIWAKILPKIKDMATRKEIEREYGIGGDPARTFPNARKALLSFKTRGELKTTGEIMLVKSQIEKHVTNGLDQATGDSFDKFVTEYGKLTLQLPLAHRPEDLAISNHYINAALSQLGDGAALDVIAEKDGYGTNAVTTATLLRTVLKNKHARAEVNVVRERQTTLVATIAAREAAVQKDIFTKPLQAARFKLLRAQLMNLPAPRD